jgi:hypothetical protein
MNRYLFTLATILSVVLSLAALAMQVRSGYATDSWELPPRFAPNFYAATKSGRVTHRHVESTAGRLVWVNYEVREEGFTPPVSYQVVTEPLAPGQWGRGDVRHRNEYLPLGTEHGRIPYVAEWYLTPGGGRYITVPWLVLMFAGAALPVARWLWSKRRVRAATGPAFPIIPGDEI